MCTIRKVLANKLESMSVSAAPERAVSESGSRGPVSDQQVQWLEAGATRADLGLNEFSGPWS